MIVSELIKALLKCPEDATVRIYESRNDVEIEAARVSVFEHSGMVVMISPEHDDEWVGETVIYDHMKERG